MDPRTAGILTATVREFIRTGSPVSSQELYRRYGFDVKPATIRNELLDLTEAGFLEQPHTSAGRIPSDRGYRFLVERIFEDLERQAARVESREMETLRDEFSRGALHDFIGDFAEALNVLGAGYGRSEGNVVKSGLGELFEDFVQDGEVTDLHELQEIIEDFETLDERMNDLLNFIPQHQAPRVFIGRSPITRSRHLSVIADRLRTEEEEFIIAAIGPKRMNYAANINFFITLKEKCSHADG